MPWCYWRDLSKWRQTVAATDKLINQTQKFTELPAWQSLQKVNTQMHFTIPHQCLEVTIEPNWIIISTWLLKCPAKCQSKSFYFEENTSIFSSTTFYQSKQKRSNIFWGLKRLSKMAQKPCFRRERAVLPGLHFNVQMKEKTSTSFAFNKTHETLIHIWYKTCTLLYFCLLIFLLRTAITCIRKYDL